MNNNNAALELSKEDVQHKAQADRFLAESLKILKQLETERRREHEKAIARPSIVAEVKAILSGKS